MNLHILIPAAGSSLRMRGRDKLVEDVLGEPLLGRQARTALSLTPDVTVALPAFEHPFSGCRTAALSGLNVETARYAASAEGLGGTVSSHVTTLPEDATHLMVFLPDLVELTPEDVETVVVQAGATPVRAASKDHAPGHPVIFPASLFPELAACSLGDDGPRQVLKAHPPLLVPLANDHAIRDLDTPEDWAAWRAAQSD